MLRKLSPSPTLRFRKLHFSAVKPLEIFGIPQLESWNIYIGFYCLFSLLRNTRTRLDVGNFWKETYTWHWDEQDWIDLLLQYWLLCRHIGLQRIFSLSVVPNFGWTWWSLLWHCVAQRLPTHKDIHNEMTCIMV